MGWVGLSFWLLLKQMTAKPVESSWLNAIISLVWGGLLLYWGLPWEDTLDKAQVFGGAYGLLLGILMTGEQILIRRERKAQEQARQQEEEEETPAPSGRRREPSTPSARVAVAPVVEPMAEPVASSCGPTGAAYGVPEESPISTETVEEQVNVSTVQTVNLSTEAEEKNEKENSSPTLTTSQEAISPIKRITYNHKYI